MKNAELKKKWIESLELRTSKRLGIRKRSRLTGSEQSVYVFQQLGDLLPSISPQEAPMTAVCMRKDQSASISLR
jgi:hypothetical protein